MESFHNRLVTIQGTTGNTAKFSWDPLEGAAYYEVYRNDQLIDTTQDGYYQDSGLETSTTYDYHVRAMDQNDNPLLTSYFRTATTTNVSDAPVVDTAELEQTISEVEEVPAEARAPELQSALENAYALIEDDNAGQDQIDESVTVLTTALSNNDETKVPEEESSEEATAEESTESSTEEPTLEESTEEATTEESAEPSLEESTEEATAEPSIDEASTVEETAEEVTTEEEPTEEETSEAEIDTAQESEQATAQSSNTLLIIGAIVLFILAAISAIVLLVRRN